MKTWRILIAMRGLFVLSCVLIAGIAVAAPSYKAKLLAPMVADSFASNEVMSFCRNGAIALGGYLYSGGKMTYTGNGGDLYPILRQYWTNSAGQFVDTKGNYAPKLTGPWKELRSDIEFYRPVIRGLTETGTIFGELASDPENRLGFLFDMETETMIHTPVLQNEAERHRVLVGEHGEIAYANVTDPTDASTYRFCRLLKSGDPRNIANYQLLGDFLPAGFNDLHHLVGVGANGIKVWDGQTLQSINTDSFIYGGLSGFANDGTIMLEFLDLGVGKGPGLLERGTHTPFLLQDITTGAPGVQFYNAKMRADGQIAALGVKDGKYALYQLSPVPEPASLAALGVGVLALLRRKRH